MIGNYESVLRGREGQSAKFKTTLIDAAGVVIPAASLTSLTATLVCLDDHDTNGDPLVVNLRQNVNVLNANGATMDTQGLFQWGLSPADMAILDESRSTERHLLILTPTYNAGADSSKLRYLILVSNTEMV